MFGFSHPTINKILQDSPKCALLDQYEFQVFVSSTPKNVGGGNSLNRNKKPKSRRRPAGQGLRNRNRKSSSATNNITTAHMHPGVTPAAFSSPLSTSAFMPSLPLSAAYNQQQSKRGSSSSSGEEEEDDDDEQDEEEEIVEEEKGEIRNGHQSATETPSNELKRLGCEEEFEEEEEEEEDLGSGTV
eukprot:TRINITY_DN5749_c0_g1_i1.p1 TRINITY_DN5749_c0_g1~~TRINITY_DN5749_c0_g1_i1.p1  ORF type:complete len:186 (-),score=66.67 TRINITY_DN5749_c0_g1_i1:69-626(-)